jgi:hypothetical protein
VDHAFFAFKNEKRRSFSVVYRRENGGYGQIRRAVYEPPSAGAWPAVGKTAAVRLRLFVKTERKEHVFIKNTCSFHNEK